MWPKATRYPKSPLNGGREATPLVHLAWMTLTSLDLVYIHNYLKINRQMCQYPNHSRMVKMGLGKFSPKSKIPGILFFLFGMKLCA